MSRGFLGANLRKGDSAEGVFYKISCWGSFGL